MHLVQNVQTVTTIKLHEPIDIPYGGGLQRVRTIRYTTDVVDGYEQWEVYSKPVNKSGKVSARTTYGTWHYHAPAQWLRDIRDTAKPL
jgi:hypothetical protein